MSFAIVLVSITEKSMEHDLFDIHDKVDPLELTY